MKTEQSFSRLCKAAGNFENLGKIQDAPDELTENIKKAELNVEEEEIAALATLGFIFGGIITTITFIISFIFGISILIPILSIPLPIILYFSTGLYPKWKAERMESKRMGGAPRFVSYLIVSLKINPNLEEAVMFSVRRSATSLGKHFRGKFWKTYLKANRSATEALTEFGRDWGKKCNELKRSIDLIKSSLSERTKKARKQILDRALETCFEGAQERMESFAAKLKLPTTLIYGVGVLLPLVLLAVLPVLSSTGVRITGFELGLIYCLGLPLTVYTLEKWVIAGRPDAFSPADVPMEHNFGRSLLVSITIATTPPVAGFLIKLNQTILAVVLIWSISLSISSFCFLSSRKSYNKRKLNSELESELCDSLVQLGSQLKSKRPVEKALSRTAETTSGSRISEILKRTSINMKVGGITLKSALFDPEDGSLKDVHSQNIRHTFKILTDLLNRSSQVAGEAVLNLGKHLRKLKEARKETKRNLRNIVDSMKSVALFFAPFVAAVTVQLQQMLSEKTSGLPFFGSGVPISSSTFLGVLGFYVVTLTVLLSSYIVEIEFGDDEPRKRMMIASALPTATGVFTLGLILGNQLLSFLLG